MSLLASPAWAIVENYRYPMEVSQAYKAVEVTRVPFRPDLYDRGSRHAVFLKRLFELTDAAAAERVYHFSFLLQEEGKHYSPENYNTILVQLQRLKPSSRQMHEVRKFIVEAIVSHKAYFDHWSQHPWERYAHNSVLIRRSHRDIDRAYNILMRVFTNASDYNKAAFLSHLSALNFRRIEPYIPSQ